MYLGEVVEIGPAEQLFTASAHPYTRALLSSMPSMDPENRTLTSPLSGDPQPHRAAERLPLSHPLPACEGGLRRGETAAGGGRGGAPERLPDGAAGLAPASKHPLKEVSHVG